MLHGCYDAAPGVFIAEGLSWYLTEDQNARLLDNLTSLARQDSRLWIDIASRDFSWRTPP